MTRSPQEIFTHHLDALSRRDIGDLGTDYEADALIVTPQGAMNGTLLGMSFLSRLRSFKVEDGVLTLQD